MVKYSSLTHLSPEELQQRIDAAMAEATAPQIIPENPKMAFFCKDCQKIIQDPIKQGKLYEYQCSECQGFRVVFGTEQAILNYFKPDKASQNAY